MSKGNIYRLIGEKKPTSWGLRLNNVMIEKPGHGLKFMNYFPGSDSLYVEDNKGKEPQPVVFEFNEHDATELVVHPANTLLNELLQKHPDFNVKYELYSEEISSERKLDIFEKKEKALLAVNDSDDLKIQAMALAILGMAAYGWPVLKCRAELKEKAINEPELILKRIDDKDYESLFLSALSFFSGIVKENLRNTAVVWNDGTEGIILHLAKGENGINKFAELLAEGGDEARVLIQEIDSRLSKVTRTKTETKPANDLEKALNEKDAEIERLKALLASAGSATEQNEDNKELTLEEAQQAYLDKVGSEVPTRYKNDLGWITTKLKE